MNFITLNVNKIMAQQSNATIINTENDDQRELVKHNLEVLHQCHKNGARYRIRRGLYNGRKVAVIVEARTFLDKLFSYLPSGSSLKERFSEPLKRFIGKNSEIGDLTLNYLSYGNTIPNVSTTQVSDLYTPTNIYNPWCNLPKTLDENKYNVTGADVNVDEKNNHNYWMVPKTQETFDNEAPCDGFSNLHVTQYSELAFVEVPGIVTTVSFPEAFLQASKFYDKPTVREAILQASTVLEARKIAADALMNESKSSESKIDDSASSEDMDNQLMLKIIRTRAQQDSNFKKMLILTGTKPIFNITDNDKKWGCVKLTNKENGNTYYEGKNLMGRILMMVRDEINNKKIPHETLERVQIELGIHQKDNT